MQPISTDPTPSGSGITVWHNGSLKLASDVKISPFDHGFTTGDGVFETLIAFSGEPFAFTRHYARLTRSCDRVDLITPPGEALLESMRAVLQHNDLGNRKGRLRVTITGGDSPLGSDRALAEQTLIVAASELPEYAPTASVVTVPFARNEKSALVGVKSTSYGENVVALKYARNHGATEAIFGNTAGNLCEGSSTNIFAVFDGRLVTPPLSSGCLGGVTREIVLDLCRQQSIEFAEEDTPLSQIQRAEEAFLTSSLRHVQPVESIDGTHLPDISGPITARLRKLLDELTAKEIDP